MGRRPELVEEPTYLIWQLMADKNSIVVHRSVYFRAIEVLRTQSGSVGELILKHFDGKSRQGPSDTTEMDALTMIALLKSAAQEGLVTTGISDNVEDQTP